MLTIWTTTFVEIGLPSEDNDSVTDGTDIPKTEAL